MIDRSLDNVPDTRLTSSQNVSFFDANHPLATTRTLAPGLRFVSPSARSPSITSLALFDLAREVDLLRRRGKMGERSVGYETRRIAKEGGRRKG